jgi:uncharacterized membrane protein YjgN (DUF898 family)
MQRAFRIVKRIFLVLTLLLLLAVPVVGLVSAAFNWEGVCYGFTDGESPCSWWEFARNEMFWATFIFVPFFFLDALVYIRMTLAEFIASLIRRRRREPPAAGT